MKNSRLGFIRRPWFWIALVTAVVIAGGAFYYFSQPAARTRSTALVSRGDLSATVTANGRVRAKRSVKLSFPLAGMITAVNVQEGAKVKQGDVLAVMDSREAQRRVTEAQLALANRLDELAAAQQPLGGQELEIAQQTLKKAALALAAAQDRYKKDATDENRITQELAQSDYDIARANFDRQTRGASAQDVARLQRAVDAAQQDLDAAQLALDATQLRAPFDGTVTTVNANVGELMGGYNAVIELADTTQLELLADIDEIDVGAVQEGQSVDMRFDAFPGETATGKLTRLFPAASTDRGATVYRAVIALDATPLKLRPGMGATVNIATVERKDVLRVPARAIKSAGTQKVVVVEDGTGTRNVVVETGLSDGNETEIISGVKEGTVVVID